MAQGLAQRESAAAECVMSAIGPEAPVGEPRPPSGGSGVRRPSYLDCPCAFTTETKHTCGKENAQPKYVCHVCKEEVKCEEEISGAETLRCKTHGGGRCGACKG